MAKEEIPAPSYPRAELIQLAQELFGVKPEVLEGAFADQLNELTVEQASKQIERFLNRKVD